ncbi:hypothetical protein [Paenibacillus harenae]|uniref:hypothetical protein n=1 Tax=Paenibacillus harenae TaxID=306543 RepID=UPI0027939635|nr:hypothetical protein [Paenibacillus harenae]MDQ0059449.1 hypothetical protein [Paenibacillus harenae]
MKTIYAIESDGQPYYTEEELTTVPLASITVIPVINEVKVLALEGLFVASTDKWVSLKSFDLPTPIVSENRRVIGSVDKATVISRVRDHLSQQSEEETTVTLSNTSTHCEEIGGRIAKQVVSTIEGRNYFDVHLVDLGWQVTKAGKDFITLERKPSVEETAEEEVKAAVEQAVDNKETVEETEEGSKRSFLEKLLR